MTTLSLIPEAAAPASLITFPAEEEGAGRPVEEGAPASRPPQYHPPVPRTRTGSLGAGRTHAHIPPGAQEPPKRQFVIHKVSSKSLLTSGLTASGVSRQSSQGGTPRGSRPPSRPPSRPASRPPSRAPSPAREGGEDSLGELPQRLAKLPRFSVLAVEGERGGREKSPTVSFSEERQYQTVHAGCEIPVKPSPRERTRSGRFSREWRSGRPSVIDWTAGKFPWTRDRRSSGSGSKNDAKVKPVEPAAPEEATSARLSPKSRPRSKSDRFTRPTRKQVVDVYKQAAFDWPLGPLGRIKQKYGKSRVPKAKSEDQLAEVGEPGTRLKRRSSERQKRSKGVQFEDQQATPWWNYPLKMMRGAAAGGSATATSKRRRRRHYTDPESRKAAGATLSAKVGFRRVVGGSRGS